MKRCPLCGEAIDDNDYICRDCENHVFTSFKSYLATLEPEETKVLGSALNADLTSFLLTPSDVLDFAEAMKPKRFFEALRWALKYNVSLEDILTEWQDTYSEEIAEWLK